MQDAVMVPLLPCHAINPMLDFYRTLGFEVTYQQSKPNNYAVVCYGKIELHFFTMPQYVPADSYSTCYVRVPDVDSLYQVFMAGLRQQSGRVPWVGIPRVIPLKNKTGRREFIIVDPGGNWIRIGQVLATPAGGDDAQSKATTSKLAQALDTATSLWDAEHQNQATALLDRVLASDTTAPASHRFQALVYRLSMAITQGDTPHARRLLTDMRAIALTEEERTALAADLKRADDLANLLG